MEGAQVLITDLNGGVSFNLLEWLDEKQAIPYVLVKDFENAYEVSEDFQTIVPVVFNVHQSFDSTIHLLSSLPTMNCIFNFDGEQFENIYRQAFDHFNRAISVCKDNFDINDFNEDIRESISEGYTLIFNITTLFLPSSRLSFHGHLPLDTLGNSNLNSSQNLKLAFEKLFSRKNKKIYPQARPRKIHEVEHSETTLGHMNPISGLLRRFFTKFSPCCTTPVMHLIPSRSIPNAKASIKSPGEIRQYIRSQESQEIRSSFRTIHASACVNWAESCKANPKPSPEFEKQFQQMCNEIERRCSESRRLMLERINKDIDRTRQFNHVLGARTVNRLKHSRERDIDQKVQQFRSRKIAEAVEKINEEIKQHKLRIKGQFYREVVDEQVVELVRIKEKYMRRLELLMLPYTGELTIPQ